MEWLTGNWIWVLFGSFLIVIHFISYRSHSDAYLVPESIKHSNNRD